MNRLIRVGVLFSKVSMLCFAAGAVTALATDQPSGVVYCLFMIAVNYWGICSWRAAGRAYDALKELENED